MDTTPKAEPEVDLEEGAKQAARFLKALANENRLLILCHLAEKEMSVTELEDSLGIRQPTLSQQLARLRTENLVATRREGKTIYYHLASEEAGKTLELMYGLFCATDSSKPAKREPGSNAA